MTAREHLRALSEALPPDAVATVPVAWLRALFAQDAGISREDALGTTNAHAPSGDLTAADIAAREKRRPSTVRGWLERGDFPGAYRMHGREWRVPPASYAAWQERQRQGGAPAAPPDASAPLSDWRRVMEREAS